MPSLYEAELRERAEHFIKTLKLEGVQAAVLPDSLRDFSVKISVRREGLYFGNVVLYYSSKRKEFKLVTHELKDTAIVPMLESCWQGLAGEPAAALSKGCEVYVDGSHSDGPIGYGWLVVIDGKLKIEYHGVVTDPDLQSLRQVAGELTATMEAVQWCVEQGVPALTVCYDYEGIEKWPTGEWRTKQRFTEQYAKVINSAPIRIEWRKVKSHTGNRWNERADRLAKDAIAARRVQPTTEDRLSQLSARMMAFAAALKESGIAVEYSGIIKEQFARLVVVGSAGEERGYFDLYHTQKKPWRAHPHAFRDAALEAEVKRRWQEFHSGAVSIAPASTHRLDEVVHYYETLKPYRECNFDFIQLAEALSRTYDDVDSGTDLSQHRYDFNHLEMIYFRLKGQYHD